MRRAKRTAALSAFLLALALGLMVSGCATSPAASAPTPTPTPATPAARLSARVQQILQGIETSSTVRYDATQRTAEVMITLTDGVVPRSVAEIARVQERVKSLCFQAQHALWTSGTPLLTVTASVLGPMFDDYADLIIRGYGGAILSSESAEQFAWASLDADSAWGRYDQTWLSSEFFPNEQFWPQPTATPHP